MNFYEPITEMITIILFFLSFFQQCGKWMTEVIKVLGWESHNSIEKRRAIGAERDLEQLRSSVLSLQTLTQQQPEGSTNQQNASNINISKDSNDDKKQNSAILDEIPRSHLSVDDNSFIEEVF